MNIPFQNNCEALLVFLDQMAEWGSVSAKTFYFLAAQFNEYKPFFGEDARPLSFELESSFYSPGTRYNGDPR